MRSITTLLSQLKTRGDGQSSGVKWPWPNKQPYESPSTPFVYLDEHGREENYFGRDSAETLRRRMDAFKRPFGDPSQNLDDVGVFLDFANHAGRKNPLEQSKEEIARLQRVFVDSMSKELSRRIAAIQAASQQPALPKPLSLSPQEIDSLLSASDTRFNDALDNLYDANRVMVDTERSAYELSNNYAPRALRAIQLPALEVADAFGNLPPLIKKAQDAAELAEARTKEALGRLRGDTENLLSDSFMGIMQGKPIVAARNLALGLVESVQHGIADSLAKRANDALLGTDDKNKGLLGGFFEKIFGGILGVKSDPAEAAAQTANTQAINVNSNLQAQNNLLLQANTTALQLSHAASLASGGGLGGCLLHSLFGGLLSAFTGGAGGDIFQAFPWATSPTDLSRLSIFPHLAIGGSVTSDGLAYLHRGEEVVPAGVDMGWEGPQYSYSNNHNYNYSSSNDKVHHTGNITVKVEDAPYKAPNGYYQRRSDKEIGEAILKLIAPALNR